MDETKSGAGRGVLVIARVVGAFITVATSPAVRACEQPGSRPELGAAMTPDAR
jgi:hypothetical protein